MPDPMSPDSSHDSTAKDSSKQTQSEAFDIVRYGSLEEVQELIAQGCDIKAIDNDENSLLHAAINREHPGIAKMLIEAGAGIHARDNQGRTPLILAADEEFPDLVLKLLELGAYINARDNNGFTALHWVITGRYLDMVKLLVENGADVDIENEGGESPLLLSKILGHDDIAAILKAHSKKP